MSQKHTYTNELAPTNTGSLLRPARFNLRLTCQSRARTHKAFQAVRELCGMPKAHPTPTFGNRRCFPQSSI